MWTLLEVDLTGLAGQDSIIIVGHYKGDIAVVLQGCAHTGR